MEAVKMRRKIWLAVLGVLLGTPAVALELPNGRLTPGAIGSDGAPMHRCLRPRRSALEGTRHLCATGTIPSGDGTASRFFREYGIPHEQWSQYTVDHLVPIEIGGRPIGIIEHTWDLRNVWPEPKAEAEQKGAVENALHKAVCYRGGYRGLHLSLQQAKSAIARDWTRNPLGLPLH